MFACPGLLAIRVFTSLVKCFSFFFMSASCMLPVLFVKNLAETSSGRVSTAFEVADLSRLLQKKGGSSGVRIRR